MACLSERAGSDATRQYFTSPGAHLSGHHKMKQVFFGSSRWCISCRVASPIWHVRNTSSQTVAMEDMQASNIKENSTVKFVRWQEDEIRILIEAKNQQEMQKLELLAAAGVELKTIRTDWKEIEKVCRERGVHRGAQQCRSKWRRVIAAYSQIKSWEENRTLEQICFWSMTMDERKTNGFISISNVDRTIYDLLDQFNNSRAGVVKDDLSEDDVEEVAELGSGEPMLPGQTFPVGETHESLVARSVFTETSALNEQPSGQPVGLAASSPTLNKAGDTDMNLSLKNDLEAGDTIYTNVLSVNVQGAPEKPSRQAPDIAVSIDETHQRHNISTETLFDGVEIHHEGQTGQITKFVVSPNTACEGHGSSSHFISTAVECTEVLNEKVASGDLYKGTPVAASMAETQHSQKPSTQFSSVDEDERQTRKVAGYADSAEGTSRASSLSVSTDVEALNEMQFESGGTLPKSTFMTVKTTDGIVGSTMEGSHLLPSQECQGVVGSVPDYGTAHSSKFTSVGQEYGNGDELPNQDSKHCVERLQEKDLIIGTEQNEWPQPVRERSEKLNATTEDDCCWPKLGEACEGKGVKLSESPTREVNVSIGDDKGSGPISDKERMEGQGLIPYDSRKLDQDIVMYVPAAIGNVLRSVSQTFKKYFKL